MDVDLLRPAAPVTPSITPPAVVMTGVTASITGREVDVAEIGATFADPLGTTGAVEDGAMVAVVAAAPDGVVDAAAAAKDVAARVAAVGGEATLAKDFFLSSAKAAVAAASAAAVATALGLETSSVAAAAASAAAFAAAASATSQAFAAAIKSDEI